MNNVQEGDLAEIISTTNHPENIGAIVKVRRPLNNDERIWVDRHMTRKERPIPGFMWVCTSITYVKTDAGTEGCGIEIWCEDKYLRPLRDPDADQEITTEKEETA